MRLSLQLILLLLLFTSKVKAEVITKDNNSANIVNIGKLTQKIEFDGSPFEEAWNTQNIFRLVQHRPINGAAPSEPSEVVVAYDDEFLWIGARLFMSDASKIASKTMKRDDISYSSDSFSIILDSFNDNENALVFGTKPSGLRFDYTVSGDAVTVMNTSSSSTLSTIKNYSWNTFWDVKTTRDNKGWYVEMKIPLSSLRFQSDGNMVKMGMILNRTISSANEVNTFPNIDSGYGTYADVKPSQAAKVTFENLKTSNPVYLSPYIKGMHLSVNELNTTGLAFENKKNNQFDAGLDIKYNITSNLTLDITANTDFAQVEADDQQVNLTRYSLYFPEKRLFFQERASIFSYSLGGFSDMFYSRRIGIENGNLVDIYGGAKLIGRIGKWDIGALDMHTAPTGENLSWNYGVLRARRQVFNENSYMGGIITSKTNFKGKYDLAVGLDGIFRISGDHFIDLKLAQEISDQNSGKLFTPSTTLFRINLDKRSQKGFSYSVTYSYLGDSFDPKVGYLKYKKAQGVDGELRYTVYSKADSKMFRTTLYSTFERMHRLSDGKLENMILNPGLELFAKSGYMVRLSSKLYGEGVKMPFNLTPEVTVPAGNYNYASLYCSFFTPMTKPYSASAIVETGKYYDGKKSTVSLTSAMGISSALQITALYSYNKIDFPKRETRLRSHLLNLKFLVMLNTKLSATIMYQYNSIYRSQLGNFRIRYNPSEGNDLYIVLNDDRTLENPGYMTLNPPLYNSRSLIIKYTHTFKL